MAEPTPLLTPDERTKLAAGRDIGVAGNKRAAATIDALTDQVAALKVESDILASQLDDYHTMLVTARAERDALKVALKPFAEFAKHRARSAPDDSAFYGGKSGPVLTHGDFRRAYAALCPTKPQEGGDAEGE